MTNGNSPQMTQMGTHHRGLSWVFSTEGSIGNSPQDSIGNSPQRTQLGIHHRWLNWELTTEDSIGNLLQRTQLGTQHRGLKWELSTEDSVGNSPQRTHLGTQHRGLSLELTTEDSNGTHHRGLSWELTTEDSVWNSPQKTQLGTHYRGLGYWYYGDWLWWHHVDNAQDDPWKIDAGLYHNCLYCIWGHWCCISLLLLKLAHLTSVDWATCAIWAAIKKCLLWKALWCNWCTRCLENNGMAPLGFYGESL